MNALLVWHTAWGYLKKPKQIFMKTIIITQLSDAIEINVTNIQYHLWDQGSFISQGKTSLMRHRRFYEKNTHPYTIICQNMKIDVWGLLLDKVKISVWSGKTFCKGKPYKKLRKAFRWCFCKSYKNIILVFHRTLSNFQCWHI